MILSASRRTDIPALYSDWFLERLKEGEVLVPNPFIVGGKTARVKLEPIKVTKNVFGFTEVSGTLEGIVFWTKNPKPLLARIDELKGIACYFQYTLNPYGTEYESNLPPIDESINTFVELSKHCPVMWRYDPIFLSKSITIDWHIKQFETLARKLSGSTNTCIINTLIGRHKDAYSPKETDLRKIVAEFVKIGNHYGITIKACAEIIDLQDLGVERGRCVDSTIFEKLLNAKLKNKKFNGASRKNCNCIESIDIGTYSTCSNGCVYCYAKKGVLKTIETTLVSEVYERKVERIFDYL